MIKLVYDVLKINMLNNNSGLYFFFQMIINQLLRHSLLVIIPENGGTFHSFNPLSS